MGDVTATRGELQSQRQEQILIRTRGHGRVEVTALADAFGVTTETIRRDLSELQARRLLRRVHGGAVPWDVVRFEPLVKTREGQHADEKRRIAAAAVAELPPEGTVIVDSGSTTHYFAGYFPRDQRLTVVTNSLLSARVFVAHELLDVVVLGGRVRKNTAAVVDAEAVEVLRGMTVDAVFLGCDGVSAERGLTTPYREEVAVKRAMIRAARRVVLLADHSKIGNDHFLRFAEVSEVDTMITAGPASPDSIVALVRAGLDVRQV